MPQWNFWPVFQLGPIIEICIFKQNCKIAYFLALPEDISEILMKYVVFRANTGHRGHRGLRCRCCLGRPPHHSIRFWVFLSKIVKYDLWLFQLFLVFSKSLYHELLGYVSKISIVSHTLLQEVQEHSLFCSFSWKFKCLLLAQVGKQVQNFTGGPMGIQI